MNSNNHVVTESIVEEKKDLITCLKEERQGLIEARDNEPNPTDKSWIIKQIEIVDLQLTNPFILIHRGAI